MGNFFLFLMLLDLAVLIFVIVVNIKILRNYRRGCNLKIPKSDYPIANSISYCGKDNKKKTITMVLRGDPVIRIPYGGKYVEHGVMIFDDDDVVVPGASLNIYKDDFSTKQVGEHIVTYTYLTDSFEMLTLKRLCIIDAREET